MDVVNGIFPIRKFGIMEADECSAKELKNIYLQNKGDNAYKPSLYVDFDKKHFILCM